MYGSECLPLSRAHECMLNTVEMQMLRCACGLTRRDKVPNEDIRAIMQTAPDQTACTEIALVWPRDEETITVPWQAMEMDAAGKRPRGAPKKR
ncbi:hypothetical protein Y032_0120g902 [Ancylostoma ceylanicum]|uniref:Uncharacterized protein n=1 Tax=Ancylostoma ceylanicum TaxID=53326 RepID=A0A016TAJ9_9BILA|nr:hypothetical protein Y032_0120g902 [Ancylostoma ceylanicum]